MITEKKKIRKKESDMFPSEEIFKLVQSCDHPRDKCLIMLGYDTGTRCSELLGIQIKHIKPDEHGFRIEINGSKTDNSQRTVRIIDSVPYLQDWINYHPFRRNQNCPIPR